MHDPLGEPVDEVGLLGERDEAVRREEAQGRVLPADERLHGVDAAVGEPGLRLVVQHQLARVDRVAQLAGEREVRRVVEVLGEVVAQHAGVPRLRGVHRDLGALEQLVDVDAVLARHHVADGRVDGQGQPVHVHLAADRLAEAPQGADGVGAVAQHEAELVAAEPRDRVVGTELVGEPRRDLGEQRVAVAVPEGVVDLLEPVEVDDREHDRHVLALRRGDRRRGALLVDGAVRQVGERVVLGEVGVDAKLAAQAARHGHRDGEQRDVQRAEGEGEVAVEPREPGADVRVDGRVGEVDLEHADAVQGGAGCERDVDLDRARDRSRPCRSSPS